MYNFLQNLQIHNTSKPLKILGAHRSIHPRHIQVGPRGQQPTSQVRAGWCLDLRCGRSHGARCAPVARPVCTHDAVATANGDGGGEWSAGLGGCAHGMIQGEAKLTPEADGKERRHGGGAGGPTRRGNGLDVGQNRSRGGRESSPSEESVSGSVRNR